MDRPVGYGPSFLDAALLCKKNKEEEGPAGALPLAAPMSKSVSFWEKR